MDYIEGIKKRLEELRVLKDKLETQLKPIMIEYNALENVLRAVQTESYESTEYPRDSPLQDRILFVLKQIEKGSARDVANYMSQYERVSETSIVVTTSKMYQAGVIEADKSGRKNIYYLKTSKN